ncbi:MAG TPA: phosphodiester glycosidase family protein, partial [Actinopolymorphaceae bacterium]
TYCRCRATQGATKVAEVEVVDGKVTAVRDRAGEGEIPEKGYVLVGREAGADRLAGLRVGDAVRVDYQARGAEGAKVHAAVNGRQLLVVNGVVQKQSQGNNVPPAPRTAVGFSKDGRKMFLLTADGRQPAFADGLGLDELGQMMLELGAYNAVNLDGGGSTTMLARKPGGSEALLENVPSDGRERNDPNGLALFAPKGSGKLRGLWVETVLDPRRASGSSTIGPAATDRVFPGLTRRLGAAGYDETYGPAKASPRWTTSSPARGSVDRSGVFRARTSGPVTVTASDRGVSGKLRLTVLQPLQRLASTTDQIALTDAGQSATFGVVGFDRAGNSAPFEPSEVSLSYDQDLIDVRPTESGQYSVTAKQNSGSTLLTLRVGKIESVVPVTVGLDEVVVSDFEDASQWEFYGERATGAVEPAEGKVGKGLRLTYDFTASAQTRTGGARPVEGIEIPGQPRALQLWVKAKKDGEWASLQVYDGDGRLVPAFRAGYLDFDGWQQLTFTVPAGTRYPLTLWRYYSAETDSAAQYQGDIVIDELTALVPPEVETPTSAEVEDPVVMQDGTVAAMSWRFAVMSDAQFVARDPDSDIVKNARRTLREIRAQQPDFLVINGDLVDEASPADFELARRILEEELEGELPYYYVPGNHERSDGSLDNFRAVFGETQRVFDHKGTRFITVDTSGISVRASDWTQLRTLRRELDEAAKARGIGSVVLLQHVPPNDPTPSKASQLSDRKEALTIERWLAEFRRTSGKGAALIGSHVGTFWASRVDGVPQFVNGNSGKNPSTAPDNGGFTGWSLWGVDPVSGRDAEKVRRNPVLHGPSWIAAEVRPHVDGLSIDAPTTLAKGRTAEVEAVLTQDERVVPVDYPVTADWSGSPNLHVGSKSGLRPWHKAWFDPSTGTLTALSPAQIRLAVTVNGTTAEATIRIEAKAAA